MSSRKLSYLPVPIQNSSSDTQNNGKYWWIVTGKDWKGKDWITNPWLITNVCHFQESSVCI